MVKATDIDGSVVEGHLLEQGVKSVLGITAATVIKAVPGRIAKVSVIIAGSAAGTLNDCATTGSAAAGNQFGTIPTSVGTTDFNWPCLTGIVVVPGTGQTVAVSFE